MRRLSREIIIFLFILSCPCFIYAQDVKEKAREYYKKGSIYFEEGKYKEAQEEFQKALELLGHKIDFPIIKFPEEELQKEKATTSPAPTESFKEAKSPTPTAPSTPQETKESADYLIGEEDVLYISVWQNPDLSQEAIVRPDGKVSFPLVGDVQASGLAPAQLAKKITDVLKEYIKYPEVSISVRKFGGQKIIILGEVVDPGVYQGTGKRTVLEAIAMAGGFTPHAVISSVVVIKGGFLSPKGMRLDLNRALLKADMSQNIYLEPQDIIYVPKKFIANVNYFVNQIIGPISQGVSNTEKFNKGQPW